MVMCSKCHKRVAVVFVNKIDNGNKISEGLCLKCARELGIPVDNMLGNMMNQMGISPEQLENMEDDINNYINEAQNLPTDNDDLEEGGAPAIDLPQLFGDAGFPMPKAPQPNKGENGKKNDKGDKNKKKYKFLDTYCRNLTRRAEMGKLDRIIGRDKELERVIQILCRRQKNNPCLIGEPGVGKTAIAEALAQKIADGDVPYKLRGKQIYLVDLTAIVAGTQFRGQFESRILGLLNEVKEAGNVILVIDEVHNIVGAGDAEGSVNAANILKPALSRGEIRIIGATTLNEYRKYIEKDSALERRFQPVTVNEPSLAETVKMLEGIKHYYEDFHSIKIPDAVINRAVVLSERYITDRYLPDKAIDLIDEAAAKLSLNTSKSNSNDTREALSYEKEQAVLEGRFDDASALSGKERALISNAPTALVVEKMATAQAFTPPTLTQADIASLISEQTGIPCSSMLKEEHNELITLEETLSQSIIGQDEAIKKISDTIRRSRTGIRQKDRPCGSFLFLGSTGVGKTELCRVLCDALFKNPSAFIRLDMSEYMEKHSVSKLIGAPPGYVGYGESGFLCERVRRNPYSLVLLDEIEKAHPDVLNLLLQILEDGTLTDSSGKRVNFKNTLLIMTSNLISSQSKRSRRILSFGEDIDKSTETQNLDILKDFFSPEFLNRIDEIIIFNELNFRELQKISSKLLSELCARVRENQIELSISSEVPSYLASRASAQKLGARPMRREIIRSIESPLAEFILKNSPITSPINISVIDNEIVIS